MGALAATIASFLVTHLNVYGWSQQLGFAVAEVMLQLMPDRPQRRPDVAFIAYAGLATAAARGPARVARRAAADGRGDQPDEHRR